MEIKKKHSIINILLLDTSIINIILHKKHKNNFGQKKETVYDTRI